ncbi:MAG: hypothetical protein HY595_02840 [Candidatus Omnitrophica bacterium]|nr:hypothetical protein [Candidatus Omnitrophota bacterium]
MGGLTVIGLIKVAVAVTVWRSAYAAGRQAVQLHAVENDTQWLETQVVALQAPASLAKKMANERIPFVARRELPTLGTARLAMNNDER